MIGGRLLSVDPVTPYSLNGAFNRYWYANGNPYRFYDPDGRQSDQRQRDCDIGPCSSSPSEERFPETSTPVAPPNGCGKSRTCYFENGRWHFDAFDWFEAVDHWRHGEGSPVYVFTNQLDLKGAEFIANGDGSYMVHTKALGTWIIFGTITADINEMKMATFRNDYYNFDFKLPGWNTSVSEFKRIVIRNGATSLGLAIHGWGDPYEIYIMGTVDTSGILK